MTKKYLKDLSKEELTKVFHANSKLQGEIYDDMVESEMHWIGESLDYVREHLSDYSIGAYNRNYIRVKNADGFIARVEVMENEIPAFIDEDLPLLQKAYRVREEYREEEMYTDRYYELEEELEELAKAVADQLAYRFTQQLDGCYKEEYQIDYFLDFYLDARMDDTEYYITDDSYTLYTDVSYTKSFK
jgi:hypothetical protein